MMQEWLLEVVVKGPCGLSGGFPPGRLAEIIWVLNPATLMRMQIPAWFLLPFELAFLLCTYYPWGHQLLFIQGSCSLYFPYSLLPSAQLPSFLLQEADRLCSASWTFVHTIMHGQRRNCPRLNHVPLYPPAFECITKSLS